MDFAGFLEPMAKFQRAYMPVHDDGNGWTKSISIIQTLFDARMADLQIFDNLLDRIPLHRKPALSIRKIAQQRWNPNDWQTIILDAY